MSMLNEQLNRMRTLLGLSEAVTKAHFLDRVNDRLKSPYTDFTTEKPEIQQVVFKNLEELGRINFPGQHNIGVMVFKGARTYTYHKTVNTTVEHSEGSFIWAVLRANELETIVFGDATYKPKNTQLTFTLKKLQDYIAANGGNYNLTEKDLHKLTMKPVEAPPVAPKPDLKVITYNGSKWVVDGPNELLYQKNNPQKKLRILDVLDTMDQQTADQVLSYL